MCLSNQAYSGYSEAYNKALEDISSKDANKALSIAKSDLLEAESSGDINDQFVALFYIIQFSMELLDYKNAEFYVDKGLKLANQHHNTRFQSEFIGFKSNLYEFQGDLRAAFSSVNEALSMAREINDDRLIAIHLTMRAQIHSGLNSYDLALEDIKTAIEIFKENDAGYYLTVSYNVLANIYKTLEDFDSSIKYYLESRNYNKDMSPHIQMVILYNIASAYTDKKDYEQALTYFDQAITLAGQADNTYMLGHIYYGMASVYVLQEKVDEAENILLPIFKMLGDGFDLSLLFGSNILLAEIKTIKKQYALALEYLNIAEGQSDTLGTPDVSLDFMEAKVDYYVAQKMWAQAYDLMKKVALLQEDMQKSEKGQLISELKVKFNAEFDQEKLALLQKQNELQKNSIIQEKSKQKYLLGLLLLGLCVLFITFLAYRHQRKIKRHLYRLSTTDNLTNVANRRHIIEYLKKLFNDCMSEDVSFVMASIDLDHFKQVNDTYGHDIGNEVLIHFANSAKMAVKNVGKIGRLGGEEWLILIPNVGLEVMKEKLKELRSNYEISDSSKIPEDLHLSFSSGVVAFSDRYDDYAKMLNDADKAMYQAKNKGRGRDTYL